MDTNEPLPGILVAPSTPQEVTKGINLGRIVLFGSWIKGEDGRYVVDPDGDYAASYDYNYLQVFYSKWTKKCQLFNPQYRILGNLESSGNILTYCLPPGMVAEDLVKSYPKLKTIQITICQACLDGVGEVCHTPGCAMCRHKVDLPFDPNDYRILEALTSP